MKSLAALAWSFVGLASLAGAGSAGCGDEGDGEMMMRPPPMVCTGEALRARGTSGQPRSQCGRTEDFTPIHAYAGAVANVEAIEDAVVLINGSCTGTLIAAAGGPVVLTAGHCGPLGGRLLVAFNVEAEADGDALVTEATVIEQSDAPDYALLRLDALPANTPPVQLSATRSDRLAVIQHPRGRPKVIAEGDYLDACDGQLFYTDLDTLVGSSGAGVLNQSGYLIGVHTDGDCAPDGSGANRGWQISAIEQASAYLVLEDVAAR